MTSRNAANSSRLLTDPFGLMSRRLLRRAARSFRARLAHTLGQADMVRRCEQPPLGYEAQCSSPRRYAANAKRLKEWPFR